MKVGNVGGQKRDMGDIGLMKEGMMEKEEGHGVQGHEKKKGVMGMMRESEGIGREEGQWWKTLLHLNHQHQPARHSQTELEGSVLERQKRWNVALVLVESTALWGHSSESLLGGSRDKSKHRKQDGCW